MSLMFGLSWSVKLVFSSSVLTSHTNPVSSPSDSTSGVDVENPVVGNLTSPLSLASSNRISTTRIGLETGVNRVNLLGDRGPQEDDGGTLSTDVLSPHL